MAKQQKGEFDDLDSEWKDSVVSMSEEEINNRIAEIAKAESQNQQDKKDDQHLQECRLACKEAGMLYSENTKMSKLRIKYCMRILRDRGKE